MKHEKHTIWRKIESDQNGLDIAPHLRVMSGRTVDRMGHEDDFQGRTC